MKKAKKINSKEHPKKHQNPSKKSPNQTRINSISLKTITKSLLTFILLTKPTKQDRKQDVLILNNYDLLTREDPLDINLLPNDVLIFYPFDYTTYTPLRDNVTVDFAFYQRPVGQFVFVQNEVQANLSYFIIDAKKVNKNLYFEYQITAYFRLNYDVHLQFRAYGLQVSIVDKYAPSKLDFKGFDDGFEFEIRSNETDIKLPLNSHHIQANDLEVYIKQISTKINPNSTSKNSSKLEKNLPKSEFLRQKRRENHTVTTPNSTKILSHIPPKVVTTKQVFYRKMVNVRIANVSELTDTLCVTVVQRTDLQQKFQLQLYKYFTSTGYMKRVYTVTLDNYEYLRTIKLNTYYHIVGGQCGLEWAHRGPLSAQNGEICPGCRGHAGWALLPRLRLPDLSG